MWDIKILNQINQADDLKIAPFHPDMQTTGTPTWIWEVVVENRLFVHAYFGANSRWFQAALAQKEGKIYAVNAVYDVRFEHIVDDVLNDKIDIAYRQKYAGSPYVEHMISTACRNATMEIIFVKKEA